MEENTNPLYSWNFYCARWGKLLSAIGIFLVLLFVVAIGVIWLPFMFLTALILPTKYWQSGDKIPKWYIIWNQIASWPYQLLQNMFEKL